MSRAIKTSSKYQSQKTQEDYEDLIKSSHDKRYLGSAGDNEVKICLKYK